MSAASNGVPSTDGRASGRNANDLLTALRRQWVVLVAGVVVGALIGVGLALTRPDEYRAVSAVALATNDVSNQLSDAPAPRTQQDPERIAETQADLIGQPVVAQRVVRALPALRLSVRGLLEDVAANAGANSDVIRITVTASTRERARAIATAYARAYVTYRQELDTSAFQATRKALTERIRELRQQGGNQALVDRLVRKDQDLLVLQSLQTTNASVVRDPVTVDQTSPNPVRGALVGLVLGGLVGCALALWRNGRDQRLRSADEATAVVGAAHLGDLPRPPGRGAGQRGLVMLDAPGRVEAEAFRMLRTRLDFQLGGRDVQKLMVASALPGEGKTTTAANLALAFAAAGRDVALLELDLRKRDLRTQLDVAEGPGLSDAVIGAVELAEVRQSVTLPGSEGQRANGSLTFYRAGTLPPDIAEFMTRRAVADLIDAIARDHDLVIMDTPALLAVSDAQALLPLSDAVMVVARTRATTEHALRGAVEIIRAAGSPILGYVLTDSDLLVNSYGRGRYSYAYGVAGSEPSKADS